MSRVTPKDTGTIPARSTQQAQSSPKLFAGGVSPGVEDALRKLGVDDGFEDTFWSDPRRYSTVGGPLVPPNPPANASQATSSTQATQATEEEARTAEDGERQAQTQGKPARDANGSEVRQQRLTRNPSPRGRR